MKFPVGVKVSGQITLQIGDETFVGVIDGEEYFVVDLLGAARNGKDPVHALLFLADAGSKATTGPLPTNPSSFEIARANEVGS